MEASSEHLLNGIKNVLVTTSLETYVQWLIVLLFNISTAYNSSNHASREVVEMRSMGYVAKNSWSKVSGSLHIQGAVVNKEDNCVAKIFHYEAHVYTNYAIWLFSTFTGVIWSENF